MSQLSSTPTLGASPPARLVAFVSGKGGTGKTTAALSVAAICAETSRTALLDLDPQAGVSLAAGVPRASTPLSSAPENKHGFPLYPGGRALALASTSEIRRRVSALRATHGIIVADLSPALTDAAHAAVLTAGTLAVVVARTDAAGLANVDETVQLCQEQGCRVLIVPNMLGRTGLAIEVERYLRETYPGLVAREAIPLNARVADAVVATLPVVRWAPRTSAATALRSLAVEVHERLGGAQ